MGDELRNLIAKAKKNGFLTEAEFIEGLPAVIKDNPDPEQIKDLITLFRDMGINIKS